MARYLRPAVPTALCALLICGTAAAAADPAIVVLDVSGSMWGQMAGRTKIEIAREAVHESMAQWPPDRDLGLIAYGHRSKTDCADIETVVPAARLDRSSFQRAVDALVPRGMTPIGDALRTAARSLPEAGGASTILLISDGEDTCGIDPCAVAKELHARNVDLRIHVVGFDIGETAARGQLACVAEATGGRYFDARDPGGLSRALGAAIHRTTKGTAAPAVARIDWTGPAPIAATVEVRWQGPADPLDYLAFAPAGSPDDRYAGDAYSRDVLAAGRPMVVPTPAEPGSYELRYISPTREPAVLARVAVQVGAASITIEAADSAPAADLLAVRAVGPFSEQHWIGIAARDAPIGSYVSYARPDPSGTTEVNLSLPATPGDYEIRYVLNENQSIAARRPLKVSAGSVRFGGLRERYAVQEQIEIGYEGPRGEGNWVGFVQRGRGPEAYGSFAYVPATGPVQLFTPAQAGDYDWVLVVPENGIDTIKSRTPVAIR